MSWRSVKPNIVHKEDSFMTVTNGRLVFEDLCFLESDLAVLVSCHGAYSLFLSRNVWYRLRSLRRFSNDN